MKKNKVLEEFMWTDENGKVWTVDKAELERFTAFKSSLPITTKSEENREDVSQYLNDNHYSITGEEAMTDEELNQEE